MATDKTSKFVMTIDGPGGAGKDKLAEHVLATEMFAPYSVRVFNTGNFSRMIAYEAYRQNKSPADHDFKDFAIATMHTMNFLNVNTDDLKKTDVENILTSVASLPEIRDGFKTRLPHIIQAFPEDVIVVLGRITGSVYTPANLKIFLDTSPDVCAHRRALEKSRQGEDYATSYRNLQKRNETDTQWNNGLILPDDMYRLCTDNLSENQVCQTVISERLGVTFLQWKTP